MSMEEDKFKYSLEEEIRQVVLKFERMGRNKEKYFFDVFEFESLIDYYIENNNSTKAFEAASLAIQQHPKSVSIQIRRARVLLDKGRAVEALSILKKQEDIEPGNHEIFITKGTALGMLGDIQGAKKIFDHALTLDSEETANILFAIVTVLQNLNYYEHLIPYLLRLIRMEPNYRAHLYDLAYAYEKIDKLSESIFYYEKYLDEEPFSDSAWYNLGVVYNKKELYNKALEAYDFALAINSLNTFVIFSKANILYNLDRYAEAIPAYLEFVEEEPDSFEALTYLAECYEKTGDTELAKKYFHDAIELEPEYADAWFGLGVIEYNSGNADEGLIYFRKAVRLDDENPEYWYLLGKTHYIKGETKTALTCFRESLKLDAYYNEVWIDLGKIILEEKLTGRAIPYLEKAYRVTGNLPGINYLLAVFFLHRGDREKAYRHLLVGIEIDKELFTEFRDIFPERFSSRKISKLLKKNNLI
jgi:tetratricopeptide (TPR) repeat protein